MSSNQAGNKIELNRIVHKNAGEFFQQRLDLLNHLTLSDVVSVNPYLLRVQGSHHFNGAFFVNNQLSHYLLSKDIAFFDTFLKNTALSLSTELFLWKECIQAKDLIEFDTAQTTYLAYTVARIDTENFFSFKSLLSPIRMVANAIETSRKKTTQIILGICYGQNRMTNFQDINVVSGRDFWSFLSGHENLFDEVLDLFQTSSTIQNTVYEEKKALVFNRLTREFLNRFCDVEGDTIWSRLVEFNSGNYDLDKFIA